MTPVGGLGSRGQEPGADPDRPATHPAAGHDGRPIRRAVRALVVDTEDRVLLVRFEFRDVGTVWALPGGGIEPGEATIDALRRELAEEVGLHDAEIGPCIWDFTRIIPSMGSFGGQRDQVHVVRTEPFDPWPGMTWEQLRNESVHDVRWWTMSEIAAAEVLFAPRRFPQLVRDFFSEGDPLHTIAFVEHH